MLSHLVIVAMGIFVNGTTGDSAQAIAQVPSVTDCAKLINANRETRESDDGTLWYLTEAECKVIEVKGK